MLTQQNPLFIDFPIGQTIMARSFPFGFTIFSTASLGQGRPGAAGRFVQFLIL